MPSNDERADWAQDAINAFAKSTGIGDEDSATQLSDLLADLRHWADREGIGWEENLEAADSNYEEEVADEEEDQE